MFNAEFSLWGRTLMKSNQVNIYQIILLFKERGKPEYSEKNLSKQTQPTYDAGSGNRTRATKNR